VAFSACLFLFMDIKEKNRSEGGVGKQGFTMRAKFSRYSALLSELYKGNSLPLKGPFLLSALEAILLGHGRGILVKEI